MRNLLKKNLAFLLAAILCLSLTACGGGIFGGDGDIAGADWRTWGVARDGGTITRNGEDTYVLVCVHMKAASFYYDDESQTPFGTVEYPITFGDNVWDLYKGIDFSDLNGDGNSDVTMRFDDDSGEIVLVWYWDTESEQFVYQEEASVGGSEVEEAYNGLLERIYALVSDPTDSMDTAADGEYGVLESAHGLGEDALSGIGYLIEDLSGDGVPELVVGTLAAQESSGEINALYTLVDNQPQLVFEGWSRNRYTYINTFAENSNCFYNQGSSSAAESNEGVFTLSRNGRELEWKEFYFTCPEDGKPENVLVYYNTTGSIDPADSELMDLTAEEYYAQVSKQLEESVTESQSLELTPFADFHAADPEGGNRVLVLMGGALPFTNMTPLQSENHEDGTYYYADMTEDGLIVVVNTVQKRDFEKEDEFQNPVDYLVDCALALGGTDNYVLEAVEENDAYSENMSYPVYIVTYTTGGNEDTCEWTIFAMGTDSHTYLYGFNTAIDAAEDMESIYQDIFAGLYLSDETE